MKDLMQKVKSFITFDFPVDTDYIRTQFAGTHFFYQKDIPEWSTNATRQKIIATYWLEHVLKHFSFILVFAVLLTVIIFDDFKALYPGVVIIVGMISFFTLFLFQYWPTFSFHFLPKLETVKEFYEQK